MNRTPRVEPSKREKLVSALGLSEHKAAWIAGTLGVVAALAGATVAGVFLIMRSTEPSRTTPEAPRVASVPTISLDYPCCSDIPGLPEPIPHELSSVTHAIEGHVSGALPKGWKVWTFHSLLDPKKGPLPGVYPTQDPSHPDDPCPLVNVKWACAATFIGSPGSRGKGYYIVWASILDRGEVSMVEGKRMLPGTQPPHAPGSGTLANVVVKRT